jgi:hypothetical protein
MVHVPKDRCIHSRFSHVEAMAHAYDQWVICAALPSDAVRDETLPAAPTWEVFHFLFHNH